MNAVIDTNVFIFDTFEDSEHHRDATTKLDSLEKWHVPSIVFHELIWFFKARNIGLDRARLKMEEYLTNEKTNFTATTADDIRFAVAEMHNYRKYNDLLILHAAKRLASPLFTFDEELKRIAVEKSISTLR